MKQLASYQQRPTHGSLRKLISMSLLALLLVCSIFVQGASASHAAPPPTHKSVVKPHGPTHRPNVHVPTRPTRPPDPPRHGAHPAAGLSLQWFNQTGARIFSSPAVANGVVYFGSQNGFFYAVNSASSKLIWSYRLDGGTYCSPTVYGGVVYICTDQVYALQQDPNNPSQGKLLWTTPSLGPMQARPLVTIVNGNPMLFVGAATGNTGNMYAFDANGVQNCSGSPKICNPLWTYQTGGAVYSSATVATVNGVPTVYFGSDDFNVYALNASTGAFIWSYKTGSFVTSTPAVAVVTIIVNGQPQTIPVVFIGSYDFKVYALDASTGAFIWSYNTGGNVTTSPAVATVTINGVSTSVVYLSSIDGYFYAILVATGTVLWREKTGGGYWDGYQFESSPTVGTIILGNQSTPVVYVGSNTNYLYALNAITGTTVWLYETGWQVESSPSLDSGSNMVYVGSDDGNLYAMHADSGAEAWRYTATSSVLAAPTTAIVNGIDTVYETDFGGAVYAFKASDGSLLWRFQAHGEIGHGWHTSGPTVAVVTINVNGQPQTMPVLFVGSNGGDFYALNAATGTVLWSDSYLMINGHNTQLGWPNTTPVVGTVTINGQSITAVYFGTIGSDPYIYALNVFDGSYLWRVLMPSTYGSSADSPAVATNVIINGQSYTVLYTASYDPNNQNTGYVYALDASSGSTLWTYQTPPYGAFDASPTVVDNVVYIGSWANAMLYALDASSGSVLWSYQDQNGYGSQENKAAVVGGVVYFVDNYGYLNALDATQQGKLLWSYQPTADYIWSDPVVYGGVVYVGAQNDSVYGISTADGSVLWSFHNPYNPSNIFQAAPVVDSGRIFAGSDDGYVYALSATNSFQAPKLQVSGNRLIDQNTGQPVVLHGVNRDGTEFGCINPSLNWNHPSYNFFPDKHGITDVELTAMRNTWHINAVRVPLNEDCWLNKHMPGGGIAGNAYINAVTNYVAALNQAGLVAILDLQWSAPKQFSAYDLESMPDADNSLLFWQGVAQTFAGNLSVVFDAFNEPDSPHPNGYNDSAWHCWLNGSSDINGSCYSADPTSTTAGCPNIGGTYNPDSKHPTYFYCVGMQQIVDTIRTYALTNVIMLGGLNFSKEFNKWGQYLPIDPHTGKAYSNLAIDAHMYKSYAYDQKDLLTLLQSYPLIAGEVGAGTIPNPGDPTHEEFVLPTMQFLDNPAGDQSIPAQSYLGWFWNTLDTSYHMNMTLNFFPANASLCYGQGFLAHFNGQGPPANCD